MPAIPQDKSLDSSLAFKRDPYNFIAKRCRQYHADLFETRLMLHKTICMTGAEAGALFYDPHHFMRHGATPDRVRKTLFGRGGVQGLDDEAHLHRKRMFMSLTDPAHVQRIRTIADRWWGVMAERWAEREQIVLYDELHELLTRSACEWTGVPLPEQEVGRRTRELTAMFDEAGAVGPSHWRSRLDRRNADRWVADLIDQTRSGHLQPPPDTALAVIAAHRGLDGQPLDRHTAAVELLNILRPTVAVAVYIVFCAVALYRYPGYRHRLMEDEPGLAEMFVQEVRRFYPFFPVVPARLRHDVEWKGYHLPKGRRVMLDLYGTNHDERVWDAPNEFRPERFRRRQAGEYDFVPQGGGDYYENHRCPGEPVVVELMKGALVFLAGGLDYEVPPQDMSIAYTRMPALPRSRFIMSCRPLRPRSAPPTPPTEGDNG